ncbi:hypothetical protein FOA52_005189 [Chlamydomonas sp. UWO 241]|nr:hypothetical protein FOA52_005189 [Chlamydomonas sp. UWO 241]
MTQKENIIDLKSTFGISAIRDQITTVGTGTVTNPIGSAEFTIKVTGTANKSATIRSVVRGEYVAGMGSEVGIAIRVDPTLPTGGIDAQWGYFDAMNGFYFGIDVGGLYVAYKKGGVETRTHEGAWNTDNMDGNGPSGRTLDLSKGIIYNIVFSWYGYGAIVWRVIHTDGNGKQATVTVHKFAPVSGTSVLNPNLPITATLKSDSGGNT